MRLIPCLTKLTSKKELDEMSLCVLEINPSRSMSLVEGRYICEPN